jgi:hypothetical protein
MGVSPWVNAKIKLINTFSKCHGRKPVGIYYSNITFVNEKN